MALNGHTRLPSSSLPVAAQPAPAEPPPAPDTGGVTRRAFLRSGAVGTAAVGFFAVRSILYPSLKSGGFLTPDGVFGAASVAIADEVYIEVFPTSPLILSPFTQYIGNPQALRPTPLNPAPTKAKQTSLPNPGTTNTFQQHQIWVNEVPGAKLNPLRTYDVPVQLGTHAFTTSKVLPISAEGKPTNAFDGAGRPVRVDPASGTALPDSLIYGFRGTFPGPRINAEYGTPVVVRLTNQLGGNAAVDRQDFGAPDFTFLTHLHNGHTAPESDGNPHFFGLTYSATPGPLGTPLRGYPPGFYVDNLYLNWPAGGDEAEKQSFFWFHDHRMDHTGANVYKGLVGLYPIYDPVRDPGDERGGLHLPGRRRDHPEDGSFDVDYDVPLVLFDCRLDDGVTVHQDFHDLQGEYPLARNPRTHPEWWGKTFYKHFPNHGFVGDLFTVNGVAYPVMKVKRRKYRLRFLDASVARIYEVALMTSTRGPKSAVSLGLTGDELQGQWRIPDGQQAMRMTEIATDGGLLPFAITRDSMEMWPAKRREVIVDFSRWQDGHPTVAGKDAVYLTNIMKMPTGRLWENSTRFDPDPNYKVPLIKFEIAFEDDTGDQSVIPSPTSLLRPLPELPADWRTLLPGRHIFEVKRGSAGGEIEWLINGKPFDPVNELNSLQNPAGRTPPARMPKGSAALWELRNGGGGWVHPVHLHQEEHRTVMRNGRDASQTPDAAHPDDRSREDVAALDPGESVIVFRRFRDFVGPYVAHCHNLAHEDHAMMFGWSVIPGR